MKPRIAKLTSFILFIALLFGCEEEKHDIEQNVQQNTLTASIVQGELKTRSVLVDNPTNRRVDVKWNDEDAIGVFGSASGTNVHYTTKAENLSEEGRTALFHADGNQAVGDYTAYYPFSTEASLSSGKLHLSFPSVQTFSHTNGITQPDSQANMMAAKTESGKSELLFHNLFALLRVGLTGKEGQKVKKVVFTDLAGKPVSGNFTIEWEDGKPQTVFTDSDNTDALKITLNCNEGVILGTTHISRFYLLVPARHYAKGFQIVFILNDGAKITKTIGTAGGKTLERSGLYPIGEQFPQTENVTFKLTESTTIATRQRLQTVHSAQLSDDNMKLTLVTDANFAPQKGEMIIINEVSEALPYGFAGKVTEIVDEQDGSKKVVMETAKEITELFDELKLGDAIWKEDGTIIEGAGIPLDLATHVKEIRDADGQILPFTRSGSTLNMQVPQTRGSHSFTPSFSLPSITKTIGEDDDNLNADFSLNMNVDTRVSMNIHEKELIYLYFKSQPTLDISAKLVAQYEKVWNKEIPLFTVHFTPIPVGPILITPIMKISAVGDITGKVTVTATMDYHKELPFGFNYIQGRFAYKNYIETQSDATEATSPIKFGGNVQLEGSVALGAKVYGGFNLYGLLEATANLDTRLRAKASVDFDMEKLSQNADNGAAYQSLTNAKLDVLLNPSVGVGITSLGAILNEKAQSDALDISLYEAYFVPQIGRFKVVQLAKGTLDVIMELKNKQLFKTKVGLELYDVHQLTGNFTKKIAEYSIVDTYTAPPKGKDSLRVEKSISVSGLVPNHRYGARVTVTIAGKTFYTGIWQFFTTVADKAATFTTNKAPGESLSISMDSYRYGWIDINNNGVKDEGEKLSENNGSFTIVSQEISIYADMTFLNVPDMGITALTVHAPNLRHLDCHSNKLTSLELKNSPQLKSINFSKNEITSLKISNCPELNIQAYDCQDNPLTSVELTDIKYINGLGQFKNLKSLKLSNIGYTGEWKIYCDSAKINLLSVKNCPGLVSISCDNNLLKSFDIQNCPSISLLSLNSNKFTELNVSAFTNLRSLDCIGNQLASLDISGCVNLTALRCSNNQLTSLDVSSCVNLESLICENNNFAEGGTATLMNSLPNRVGKQEGFIKYKGNIGYHEDQRKAEDKNWRFSIYSQGTWHSKPQ